MARQSYLIAYDVRDDRRLRKVARLMEGHGERVQYSLFRCHLTKRSCARLLWKLAAVLDPVDSLVVVPLCGRCAASVERRGSAPAWETELPSHTIM